MAIQTNFTPVPNGTLVLGANHYYSMDGKKTHINNNVLVVGRSGSGKTRYLVKPNLLQLNGSYVISDPKGQLYREFKGYFEANGYDVLHMDFIHPEKSTNYNPLAKIKNTQDITRIAHALIYTSERNMPDPYWENMAMLLVMGIIGYIFETPTIAKKHKNLTTLQGYANLCNRNCVSGLPGERSLSKMNNMMERHNEQMKKIGKRSWAYEQFQKASSTPDRTFQTILSTVFSKLLIFDSEEIQTMVSKDGFDFENLGKKPTALFVEVSDTDRSMDVLSNLFFTQLMNALCSYADEECENGALPIPVQFILDDFSTNVKIIGFENYISNIRSRNISSMIMCQELSQLDACYGKSSQTIISNCASCLYLGGTFQSASEFSKWANRPVHEFLNMPIDSCWLFRIGQKPQEVDFVDVDTMMIQKGFHNQEEVVENEKLLA